MDAKANGWNSEAEKAMTLSQTTFPQNFITIRKLVNLQWKNLTDTLQAMWSVHVICIETKWPHKISDMMH